MQDKNIRVEGHTDNVRITSKLARIYPSNWELSAARAINVTKYLQQQGIDPANFIGKPPLANISRWLITARPKGKAKNRRIAIILLPKE